MSNSEAFIVDAKLCCSLFVLQRFRCGGGQDFPAVSSMKFRPPNTNSQRVARTFLGNEWGEILQERALACKGPNESPPGH